jgi:hypothetical protein
MGNELRVDSRFVEESGLVVRVYDTDRDAVNASSEKVLNDPFLVRYALSGHMDRDINAKILTCRLGAKLGDGPE